MFSRNRYGQEELLNLWTTLPSCPQSILDIPELGSDEPLKPAYLAQYTEEQVIQLVTPLHQVMQGRGIIPDNTILTAKCVPRRGDNP